MSPYQPINYQLSTVNNVLNLLLYRTRSLFFSVCLFNPRSKTNESDDLILNLDLKPEGRNKKRKSNQLINNGMTTMDYGYGCDARSGVPNRIYPRLLLVSTNKRSTRFAPFGAPGKGRLKQKKKTSQATVTKKIYVWYMI